MERHQIEYPPVECSDLALRNELASIIDQGAIDSLFQPIFDLRNNTIFAYEALSRGPKKSPLFMPDIMFDTARHHHMTAELDHICRRKAVENFVAQDLPGKLSLNICPSSLADPEFRNGQTLRVLEEAGLSSDRVILELTEHKQADISKLKEAVKYYRDMGFSLALDDLGAGYSNLRLLAELKPDYLKLDKFFISGVTPDRVEAEFVKLIVDLAERVSCRVVAEGIETADELLFAHSHNIAFGQGYLLGKPRSKANINLPAILMEMSYCTAGESTVQPVHDNQTLILGDRERIKSLRLHPTPPCSPNDMLTSVLKRFHSNPQLVAIPVLDRGKVVGTMTREELLNAFSQPYAHSLYHRSSVSKLMLTTPLVVQVNDSLAQASQQATSRPYNLVYSPLIVCDGESYVGMISIRELLEKITQTQLEHALHCNPLSGLPGNVRITSEMQSRIDAGEAFVFIHFDLDNFKAFNDTYGFKRGDQMIRLVAELLQQAASDQDFVGHIGGDDFVLILNDADWEARVWSMLNAFAGQSPSLYDKNERELGYIEATDRLGAPKRFALASLSASAVSCLPGTFKSQLEVSEVIAELKHQSKKIEGNSLVTNRRQTEVNIAA